jgi:hypothetical protein
VVPAAEVDLGEETSTLQLVEELINHWNRKLVLDSAVIESSIVDAKAPIAIMLTDKEHRGGEWQSRLPYDPLLQHIITLPLNLILEELWVAVGSHSYQWGVGDEVDAVIMVLARRQPVRLLKDVRIGQQQLLQ